MQPGKWADLGPRMRSWWVIAILVGGALLLGWQATAILFALISFLALKEFLTLAPTRKEDRLIVLLAYLSVFVNYGLIFADYLFEDSYQVYLVFIAGLRLPHRRGGDGLDRAHRRLSGDRRHRALGHGRVRLQYRLHRLPDARAGRRGARGRARGSSSS